MNVKIAGKKFSISGAQPEIADAMQLRLWVERLDTRYRIAHISIDHVVYLGAVFARRVFSISATVVVVSPDGTPCTRYVFLRGDCVAVLALVTVDGIEHMVVVEQERLPAGDGTSIGLPAGILEEGESPADAAAREFSEETGLHVEAEQLINLGVEAGEMTRDGVQTSPGGSDERMHTFACHLQLSEAEIAKLKIGQRGNDSSEHTVARLIPVCEITNHSRSQTLYAALYLHAVYRQMQAETQESAA